ncbi:hypothetical protein CR513_24208, partial [Mucuna pruriens]
MGEISLPILIGPALFNINFQVMDIRLAYSFLLERPWIHTAGAVKFINNHQIISIMGEKELVITTPAHEEYIEGDEEALKASFQSLKVEGTVEWESKSTTHTPPGNIALQVMIKEGYQPGKGLGPRLGGILAPISVQENLVDNQTLENEEPDQPSELGEGRSAEAEALADIERWIDKERPKFEALTKDLESVNLGVEGREIWIGKQIPPDLRAKLIELLKEYTNIFAWSYQDMPGLDRKIVEHKLPLLLRSTPIR